MNQKCAFSLCRSVFVFFPKERNQKCDFSILRCRSSARARTKFRNIREQNCRAACRIPEEICAFFAFLRRYSRRSLTLKSKKLIYPQKNSLCFSPSYLSTKETRDAADAADVDDGERHHHSLLREQNRVLDWRDDVVFNATCASGDDEDDDDDDEKKKKKERNANERRERRRKWVRLARRPDSEEVFASSAERESRLLLHRRVADIESFDFHHSETFSPRGWERYRSERTHEL